MRFWFSKQDIEDNRNDALAEYIAEQTRTVVLLPCSCGWSDEEHDWYEHSPLLTPLWTARDWSRAVDRAFELADKERLDMLYCHSLHTWHCGGWEVVAWPCPPVATVLGELLGTCRCPLHRTDDLPVTCRCDCDHDATDGAA